MEDTITIDKTIVVVEEAGVGAVTGLDQNKMTGRVVYKIQLFRHQYFPYFPYKKLVDDDEDIEIFGI